MRMVSETLLTYLEDGESFFLLERYLLIGFVLELPD